MVLWWWVPCKTSLVPLYLKKKFNVRMLCTIEFNKLKKGPQIGKRKEILKFLLVCLKEQGPARPMMRPLATSSFFIFLLFFSFFSLTSSLHPLVPPSSSLFFPRPALSKSSRIHKTPFFIDFDEDLIDRLRIWKAIACELAFGLSAWLLCRCAIKLS